VRVRQTEKRREKRKKREEIWQSEVGERGKKQGNEGRKISLFLNRKMKKKSC